jgi:predicted transcriptional regulator
VRTTIDLKPEIHRLAQSVARDRHQTLSETINELLGRVLTPQAAPVISVSERTGLRTIRLGRVITADDVRELEDDA